MKTILPLALLISLSLSCTPRQEITPAVAKPAPPTPVPASPERVSKPVNVSFSTYSQDWPVGWEWIDPESRAPTPHNVKLHVLAITVPTGKNLEPAGLTNAPRYLKAITGDFEIQTRVDVLPKQNFQAAGLLIYWNEQNFLRFERYFGHGGEGIHLAVAGPDGMERIANAEEATSSIVDLRLIRQGGQFSAYWRPEGAKEWRFVGQTQRDYPDTLMIGLAAYNTAQPMTAKFAYITLLPVK